MKKKYKSSDFILLLLFTVFMLHHSPAIGRLMSPMFFAGFVSMLFFYELILFSRYENFFKYILPLFALFFFDILFYTKIDDIDSGNNILRIVSGVMQTLILPMLAGFVIGNKNMKLASWVLIIFLSVEFTTYITSIIAESTIPGIVRMNPGQLRETDAAMYELKASMNVGNFDTVYGCATLIPLSIFALKWRSELFASRFLRLVVLVFLLVSVYFIYVSQFAIALFVSLILLLTVFLPKYISPSYFKRTFIIGLFSVLFLSQFAPKVLRMVSDNLESEVLKERIEGSASLLSGSTDVGLDVESRQKVYMKPWNTIKNTYMFGSWGKNGLSDRGGHSFVLDHLASYGFIGLFLLIVYYKGILKLFYKPYRKQQWTYYLLYGLGGVTIFYILNPSGLYNEMLFCYPLCAFLFDYKLKKLKK